MIQNNRPYVNYKKSVLWKAVCRERRWYQCVWLFKDYCDKVLWIKFKKTWNANNIWKNTYKIFDKNRTKIDGTNDLMCGDIIVSKNGKYWHVAVVDRILDGFIYVLEQNGSGMHSWSWLWANAIRVQKYEPSFRSGIWRCEKIFKNLEDERRYIDEKLKQPGTDKKVTNDYKNSIRYVKK